MRAVKIIQKQTKYRPNCANCNFNKRAFDNNVNKFTFRWISGMDMHILLKGGGGGEERRD